MLLCCCHGLPRAVRIGGAGNNAPGLGDRVDPAFLDRLDPIGEEQDEMLGATAAERKSNSRLSCQIHMKPQLAGLIVRMPERQT